MITVLVVGYGGSATARTAVEYAGRHPGAGGKVYVVHAYGYRASSRCSAATLARGRAVLDALAPGDDPLLEAELLEGRPADAILSVAEPRRADEIVVGSRGLGRVRSALGSVSPEVLQRASVPVVVIPLAAEPAT